MSSSSSIHPLKSLATLALALSLALSLALALVLALVLDARNKAKTCPSGQRINLPIVFAAGFRSRAYNVLPSSAGWRSVVVRGGEQLLK
jgi:hypothetical protein